MCLTYGNLVNTGQNGFFLNNHRLLPHLQLVLCTSFSAVLQPSNSFPNLYFFIWSSHPTLHLSLLNFNILISEYFLNLLEWFQILNQSICYPAQFGVFYKFTRCVFNFILQVNTENIKYYRPQDRPLSVSGGKYIHMSNSFTWLYWYKLVQNLFISFKANWYKIWVTEDSSQYILQ